MKTRTLYILLTNLFFLVIYLIMKSVLQENEETARRESEAKNAALIARQYEEILERQESVRRLRHDMRHFIRVRAVRPRGRLPVLFHLFCVR